LAGTGSASSEESYRSPVKNPYARARIDSGAGDSVHKALAANAKNACRNSSKWSDHTTN